MLHIHGVVSGRVQGVYFRESTKRQAQQLNITGWVKNLPDGRVEFTACGETATVMTLLEWLKKGPLLAKVTSVDWQETSPQEYTDFSVIF